MGFESALMALKAGKRVKREHWQPEDCIFLKTVNGLPALVRQFGEKNYSVWHIEDISILAEDWEIID
jgi:hypothetical protein